jgi:hypothetical protein
LNKDPQAPSGGPRGKFRAIKDPWLVYDLLEILSKQPAPREGTIPVNYAGLFYREIGRGPPVVILHGGPDFDHTYLLPEMDRLADTFRLIYVFMDFDYLHPPASKIHLRIDRTGSYRTSCTRTVTRFGFPYVRTG